MHNDASIKYKDVKTNNSGQYITTDNILILNVVYITDTLHIISLYGFYSIYYYNKSDITITSIICYKNSSYVDHNSLNDYINNKDENTEIYAFQNLINYSMDIRLYYI